MATLEDKTTYINCSHVEDKRPAQVAIELGGDKVLLLCSECFNKVIGIVVKELVHEYARVATRFSRWGK